MLQITEFIKKCYSYYIGIANGGQSEFRMIKVFEEIGGKLYTALELNDAALRGIGDHSKVEVVAHGDTQWVRLHADAVADVPADVKGKLNEEGKTDLRVIELANASAEYFDANGSVKVEKLESTKKSLLPEMKAYEGLSAYRPPLCFELVGQTLELVMDTGFDYELRFIDRKRLSFGPRDGEKGEYAYDCLKAEEDTYFVNFEVVGADPRTGMAMVLDMEQSLTTWVVSKEGLNPKMPELPSTEIVFGAIRREDGTIPGIRHGFTSEMVGRAIEWNYRGRGAIHVYSSERYYRIMLPERDRLQDPMRDPFVRMGMPGRFGEEPANYVKIKDGIFLFSFVESDMAKFTGHGNMMCFLMDLNRLHDVGCSFGHNAQGERENYTFGAVGKYVDPGDMFERKSFSYVR